MDFILFNDWKFEIVSDSKESIVDSKYSHIPKPNNMEVEDTIPNAHVLLIGKNVRPNPLSYVRHDGIKGDYHCKSNEKINPLFRLS